MQINKKIKKEQNRSKRPLQKLLKKLHYGENFIPDSWMKRMKLFILNFKTPPTK